MYYFEEAPGPYTDTFELMAADPSWWFQTYSSGESPEFDENWSHAEESPYPAMSVDDIGALPIDKLLAKDSIAFIWTTDPHMENTLDVIRTWKLKRRTTGFYWIKTDSKNGNISIGQGYWTRANIEPVWLASRPDSELTLWSHQLGKEEPEFCFLATRGRPHRVDGGVRRVIIHPALEHSRKPDEAQYRMVQLVGDVPRVELFARRRLPGWKAWGNEVVSDFWMKPHAGPFRMLWLKPPEPGFAKYVGVYFDEEYAGLVPQVVVAGRNMPVRLVRKLPPSIQEEVWASIRSVAAILITDGFRAEIEEE